MRPNPITRLLSGIWAGSFMLASMTAAAGAQDRGSGSGAGAGPTHLKAVLELYTSQGCNSCPPADALLQTYIQRDDVMALTLPVDYWDYIGWKDTFASPKFSARQRAYAKMRGDGRVYTPQVVINGLSHVVGSSQRDIDRAITDTAAQVAKVRVPVTLRLDGARLIVETGDMSGDGQPKDATVWLAAIQPEGEVTIRAGENRGRTLKYYNVVRELVPVGMWSGKATRFEVSRDALKVPGAERCAVIVQSGSAGPILGAAMLAKF